MAIAVFALVAAPLVGNHGGWRKLPRAIAIGAALLFVISVSILMFSWRGIPGGIAAAAFGHAALAIAVLSLAELGRVIRASVADRLAGAMLALSTGALLVVGIFAVGPLAGALSTRASVFALAANPLVAVTSAAGIDLLHLDAIYRTSPLAHRGVALPAWTTACVVYAVVGLAAHGVSRIPWSRHS